MRPQQPRERGTKVYAGRTLEEAYAAAVRVHGPGARPLQARQIRGGLRGMMGRDRFEVTVAVPAAAQRGARAAEPGPVDVVLAELLDLADAEEQRVADAVHTSRTRRRAAAARPVVSAAVTDPHSLDASAADASGMPSAATPSIVPAHAAPDEAHDVPSSAHPAPAIAEHATPATSDGRPGRRPPRHRMTPVHRQMREMGVPEAVLRRLPAEDPQTPAEWVAALTAAISAEVPAPTAPSDRHPVVVSGHERAGVIAILHAGAAGWAPGTLVLDGRMVPATAEYLAWGVWTCVS